MKVHLNNIFLNYVEHGSSKGLPVVFIHGFPFSHKMWEPQIREMPKDIHAILYDVRGHGSSDVGDGQYTIELFVDDLTALLDHLAIEKAVLCGLSMGGYIALRFLEKHPTRVSGLILCNTKSESDSNETKIKRTTSIKLIKETGVESFASDFVKTIFYKNTFLTNPHIVEIIKHIICTNSSLGISGTLLALAARTDTAHILPSIAIPTCLIAGEHDNLVPSSLMQTMHKNITGSQYHIVSNAGHMSNMENINDFNRTLASFLKNF
jgi:3-oxoadipate enol-lactonase